MYTDRYGMVQDEQTFYIRMPISPEKIVVEISKNPYFDKMGDGGFKVLDIKPLPLKKKLGAFNSASPVVKNFVAFAQEFSKRASYISAKGSIYTSNDGQFQIDYLDEIRDENGMALNTPARINKSTAVIQVSKSKFD
jgi:hypothetical protein